jgi:hypothetical protein
MTTHNHADTAARSAGHPSMEGLAADEAGTIVGGLIRCFPRDFPWDKWLEDNNPVKKVVNVAKRVKDWFDDLF